MMSRNVLLGLTLFLTFIAAVTGLAFAIPGQAPRTSPGLVHTYSEFATVLLASKKTEASLVRAICTDAYQTAMLEIAQGSLALGDGNREDAAGHLEAAATAVAMIATEGDKAVAGVRNRLLEGGHHHHAKAEIAEKYDPGYVIVEKTEKRKLLDEAQALGRLAQTVRSGDALPEALTGAGKHLSTLFLEVVK
jgi:hypothetical protein